MSETKKSCIWPTFFKGYITGIVETCVLFDSFEKEELCQLLPPGYRLKRQTIASPGKHPIYWCFNLRQIKVGTPVPFLCLNYHEFAFVIPFVQSKGQTFGAYVPTLYLNSPGGVLGGRVFYQLKKNWKRCSLSSKSFDADSIEMDVRSLLSGKQVINGKFSKVGQPVPYQSSENFMEVKPMLEQPLLTTGIFGNKSSDFIIDYDGVDISPIEGNIKTMHFISEFENLKRTIPSIQNKVLGGCYFKAPWKLDLPKSQT